jgi:hypothetical protein
VAEERWRFIQRIESSAGFESRPDGVHVSTRQNRQQTSSIVQNRSPLSTVSRTPACSSGALSAILPQSSPLSPLSGSDSQTHIRSVYTAVSNKVLLIVSIRRGPL